MFNVYQQHKTSNVRFPPVASVDEARKLAEASARLGHDSFFRVFEQTGHMMTGPGRKGIVPTERFVTAFSVLDGKVREHKDVTFPKEHF